MKKTLFFLIGISIMTFSGIAQTVIQESIIQPTGKSLGVFSTFGTKSVVGGAGPTGGGLIPLIEFADIKDNGFVFRKEYKFTKYNENFEKEWEKEIEKVYGLQGMPIAQTVGKKNYGVYFVQQRLNPAPLTELHITKFDEKGNTTQAVFKSEKMHDGVIYSFVTDQGLNVITYKVNKKEKNITYSLISFSSSNLAPTVKKLKLDYTDYEVQNKIIYEFLKEKEDKLIFVKSYFKAIEGSENKEPVIKTLELKFNGETSNLKTFEFADGEAYRFSPFRLEFDEKANELLAFGYLTMNEKKQFVDGIYLYRYNYSNKQKIYSKYISFSSLLEKSSHEEMKNRIHGSISQIYSLSYFSPNMYYFNKNTGDLRLFIYNDSKGLMQNKLTVNSIFINKEGEVKEIDEVSYLNHILVYPGYRLTPKSLSEVWSDKQLKNTSLDFINSFSTKGDPSFFLWKVMPKADYDVLISVRESTGEIIAYKVK